jgi:hypothetical protein
MGLVETYGIVIIIVVYIILFVLNGIILKHIDKSEHGRTDRPPLTDKFHNLLSCLNDKYGYTIIVIIDILLYGIMGLAFYTSYYYDTNNIYLNEFMPKLLILFYVRLLCIWVTELPTSMNTNYRTILSPITVDHMFSSHTMFMMSFLIYIRLFYTKISKSLIMIFMIIYSMLIICTREHYSVDVIVAITITYFTFNSYI